MDELESFEPLPSYLIVRASKSMTNKVTVTGDPSSPSHQTTLASQDKVGEVVNPSVELSHPPTPLALDICADLDYNLVGCHVKSFSQPSSSCFVDPPYFGVLCSSILDCACDVHEHQVVDAVYLE